MSTKVVSAPAKVAKPLVHKEKTAKPAEQAQPVADEDAKLAGKEARVTEETAKVILAQAADDKEHQEVRSDTASTSMAGNFSFTGALASAAASSGSLFAQADGIDSLGFAQSDDDGGASGTILLVGAVALVGLGIAVLAGGGNGEDEVLNVAPVFGAAPTLTIAEDSGPANFTVSATDADGNALTYSGSVAAAQGTITNSGSTFTFTPADDFNGTAAVTITVNDGAGGTATQTVNVTVTPVNDAPVAADASIAVTGVEDTVITITPTISDVDGDDLTYTFTPPANGTIVVNDDGTLSYTPDANYNGTDSFVVTATDPSGESASQTVNLTITDDNDPTDPTGPAEVTIDVPATGPAVTIDASDDAFIFTDDVTVRTDVVLTGFGEDDLIAVTGADAGDYSFGTSAADANDLRITFNDGTNFTQIIIDDVLTGSGFVFNYDSAAAAVGFDFMTFA